MKKIIILILSLMLCYGTANAQLFDIHEIPTHSLTAQVADGSVESLVGVLVGAFAFTIDALANQDENEHNVKSDIYGWTPHVNVGYDYHFPGTRWNVGADLGYWQMGYKFSNGNKTMGRIFNVAATGKYFYKPDGVCKLYGGLNIGAGLFTQTNTDSVPQVIPIIQANVIGMRLGNEQIAFVSELGVGYRGILQLGVNIGL